MRPVLAKPLASVVRVLTMLAKLESLAIWKTQPSSLPVVLEEVTAFFTVMALSSTLVAVTPVPLLASTVSEPVMVTVTTLLLSW